MPTRSCSWTAMPTTTVMPARSSSFQRPLRPSERRWRRLDVVVEEADRAACDRQEEDGQRRQRVLREREERQHGAEHDQQAAHHRRSLLDEVAGRPLLADRLAELVAAQELDELRADDDRDHHRDQAGDQDSDHQSEWFASAGAMPSRPTAREALTSSASPGRTSSRSRTSAAAASGDHSPTP